MLQPVARPRDPRAAVLLSGHWQVFFLIVLCARPDTSRAAWESLAHHQALMNDAEKYPRLGKALGKASQGIVWMYHANFDADVTKALGAPVTEFALWTLPETTDREAFAPGVKKLLSVLGEHIGEEIFDGGSGPIVEDKKLYLVCLGWHDAEVRSHSCLLCGSLEADARLRWIALPCCSGEREGGSPGHRELEGAGGPRPEARKVDQVLETLRCVVVH